MEDDIREINSKPLYWRVNEATVILQWLSSIDNDIKEHMPETSEIFEILAATNRFLNPRKEYVDSITLEVK